MADNHNFKDTQTAFAAHIRNPDNEPMPAGIDDIRMQVYRDLFFNNINGLIKQTFPVLASIYDSQEWSKLIRDFYQQKHNKTPYFTEIAGEFLSFLKNKPIESKRPFLYELAHYEWLELAVEKAPHKPQFTEVSHQQLLNQVPIISPLVNGHSYQFPVHEISATNQPAKITEDTHLIIWRDRNYKVHFAQLNNVSWALLNILKNRQFTGQHALSYLFKDQPKENQNKYIEFGAQQLSKWAQQDIINTTEEDDKNETKHD